MRLGLATVITCFFVSLSSTSALSAGLIISPPKDPLPFIHQAFPNLTHISEKSASTGIRQIFKDEVAIGYAVETNDIARIPAYSGEPINTLVCLDLDGRILRAEVLEHHEPILLVGIPEQTLFDFTNQYAGIEAGSQIKVGAGSNADIHYLDGVSGATVTVMVVNQAVMKAANTVATEFGLIEALTKQTLPASKVKHETFRQASWRDLIGDGSVRHLKLTNAMVDNAFIGTDAEDQNSESTVQSDTIFADLYFTQLDIPTIGRHLLGDSEYEWLKSQLNDDEHVIALLGNGYSFKGSGYVRGGIFDRIIIHQNKQEWSFRDTDHYRINDIFIEGAPTFQEMSLFIVRPHLNFDPGSIWEVEFLIRRQTGPIDGVFTSFKGLYEVPELYISRPEIIPQEPELALWEQVWQDKSVEVIILCLSIFILTVVLFLQDWLVKFPVFMQRFRVIFLLFTVVYIGWVCKGQLSVVNVLTFTQSLMGNFEWTTFLLDPVIFILWVFVAAAIILWGRGVYCGWLCPFGALQEILGEIAHKLKIPQLTIPFVVHERLWAIKYLILLALFGLSLESLAVAEHYAEVEPFKTTFLLEFERDWPFILYAGGLLVFSLFNRKVYCRYICPLGAAIAIPSAARLFDWLKRRKDCGKPCQICANECEIGAIVPTGEINMRECHYCLDCQITYHDTKKCPPLARKYHKHNKAIPTSKQETNDKTLIAKA